MAWLGDDPLGYLRRRIDDVDDELAVLLARRTALTGAVQDHKAAAGDAAGEPAATPAARPRSSTGWRSTCPSSARSGSPA